MDNDKSIDGSIGRDSGHLLVRHDEHVETVPLTAIGSTFTIGSGEANTLVLHDKYVSRRHAQLLVQAAGALLTDLDSTYGTFFGSERRGIKVKQLRDGDSFRIGIFSITYLAPKDAQSSDEHTAGDHIVGHISPWPAVTPAVVEPASHVSPSPSPAALTAPCPLEPLPLTGSSRYLDYLPAIFHQHNRVPIYRDAQADSGETFLGRYLQIFESIWERLEQRQDHLALYFDPRTCPVTWLPWLASWLDMMLDARLPEARQRFLLTKALDLHRKRGTANGLADLIETCTGLRAHITSDPMQPFIVRVRLALPAGDGVTEKLIDDLIMTHKPAHVGYILELQP